MDPRSAEHLYLTGYEDAKTTCLMYGPEDARTWLRENPAEGGDPYRAGWAQGLADHLDVNGLAPAPEVKDARRWA